MKGMKQVLLYSVGTGSTGPLMPGESYTFTINAGMNQYLSFASMLGKSNDLFFSPGDMGIMLLNGETPVSGDVTWDISYWDIPDTEVNKSQRNSPRYGR